MPSRGPHMSDRTKTETPTETASRILAKHGLSFQPGRKPVPQEAYHELDHDLTGDEPDHQTDMSRKRFGRRLVDDG
jgi:hypothetical protein